MLLSEQLEIINVYHELSKHRQGKYARGPDSLDWDMQPNPFREFKDCKRTPLPLTANQLNHTLDKILAPHAITPQAFSRESIGQLLEVSMGLSAWKIYGSERWSLRCNPSSGNLHPTETYIISNIIDGIQAGVYHYQSHDHCLEQRCDLSVQSQARHPALPENCFVIGLSSIHWRESWKYGLRAFRYCQLDVGHAIAAIRYAAALQGWKVKILDQLSNDQISQLLGLARQDDYHNCEKETADIILLIHTNGDNNLPEIDIEQLCAIVHNAEWRGTANVLSPQGRIDWPEIDEVSQASSKPPTSMVSTFTLPANVRNHERNHLNASQLLRQRRSAQAFDGQSILSANDFFQMLAAVSPDTQFLPFDCMNDPVHIHLVFYIHRVQGIEPGLYALARSEPGMILLKNHFRDEFKWEKPPPCPQDIPLYQLVKANCRNAAKTVSCHQDIAADGAFAVSLLAEFDQVISTAPWKYRQLYYEAGMLGQALYIEAEAVGFRGTGIGCFFDDNIHEILGIHNNELQCLYNFTVGMPVVDTRLISLPPYSHLNNGT